MHLDDVELGLATPMQMLRALLAGAGGHEEFLLLALRPPCRLPSNALRTRLRCLDQTVLTAAFVRIAAGMSRERVLFDEALQRSLKLLLRRWTETNAKLTPGTAARKFESSSGNSVRYRGVSRSQVPKHAFDERGASLARCGSVA